MNYCSRPEMDRSSCNAEAWVLKGLQPHTLRAHNAKCSDCNRQVVIQKKPNPTPNQVLMACGKRKPRFDLIFCDNVLLM
jgi:hypothetical protein